MGGVTVDDENAPRICYASRPFGSGPRQVLPPPLARAVYFVAYLDLLFVTFALPLSAAIMGIKHTLDGPQAEERLTKRANSRSTSDSRSDTPAGIAFSVQYMPSDVKGRPPKKKKDLVQAELQVSPFVAKGRSSNGELDQDYTISPSAEWESMKKYNNFISKYE